MANTDRDPGRGWWVTLRTQVGRWWAGLIGPLVEADVDEDGSAAANSSAFASMERVFRILRSLIVLGLFIILLFALYNLRNFLSIVAVASITALAMLALGGFVGFLFGIPYSTPGAPAPADHAEGDEAAPAVPASYRGNTNLEQIADWLTKILVGLTLVELGNIRTGVAQFVAFLRPSLGDTDSAAAVALGILIYFSVLGFIFSFLWARLYLLGAFRSADREGLIRKTEEAAVAATLHAMNPAPRARGAPEDAAAMAAPELPPRRALWVDDNPANNAVLKNSFEAAFQIKFDLSFSTAEALTQTNSHQYALIISDMYRAPDPRAGFTLLNSLRARAIQAPFIIYNARATPEQKSEALQNGAFGMTSSPQELLQLVQSALAQA